MKYIVLFFCMVFLIMGGSLGIVSGAPDSLSNIGDFDKKNKTLEITDDSGTKLMTVKLVSLEPYFTTLTKIYEISNFQAYTPNIEYDFQARTEVFEGSGQVTSIERYIEQNVSYVVNVTDYDIKQVKEEIYNNKTGKNETILVNKTVIIGYHDETRYTVSWVDYQPYQSEMKAGVVQGVKVVYHKTPELGPFCIQTVPMFRGVECPDFTWWNGSWTRRVQLNVNNSAVALTDYQLMKNITYDSDMNSDFSDLRFTDDGGTVIPYWIESKVDSSYANIWLKIPSISTTTGAKVWMYYKNSGASSTSNGDDTFIQYHGSATASYLEALDLPVTNIIGEWRLKWTNPIALQPSLSNNVNNNDDFFLLYYNNAGGLGSYGQAANENTPSGTGWDADIIAQNTYHRFRIEVGASSAEYFTNDVSIGTVSSNLPNENLGLGVRKVNAGESYEQDWAFVRKYTATEPTWGADGEEETYVAPTPTPTPTPTTPAAPAQYDELDLPVILYILMVSMMYLLIAFKNDVAAVELSLIYLIFTFFFLLFLTITISVNYIYLILFLLLFLISIAGITKQGAD